MKFALALLAISGAHCGPRPAAPPAPRTSVGGAAGVFPRGPRSAGPGLPAPDAAPVQQGGNFTEGPGTQAGTRGQGPGLPSLLASLDALDARLDALGDRLSLASLCNAACLAGVQSAKIERGHVACRCVTENLGRHPINERRAP
jgi:hypothetical protein